MNCAALSVHLKTLYSFKFVLSQSFGLGAEADRVLKARDADGMDELAILLSRNSSMLDAAILESRTTRARRVDQVARALPEADDSCAGMREFYIETILDLQHDLLGPDW
jgi:hypothetical protein